MSVRIRMHFTKQHIVSFVEKYSKERYLLLYSLCAKRRPLQFQHENNSISFQPTVTNCRVQISPKVGSQFATRGRRRIHSTNSTPSRNGVIYEDAVCSPRLRQKWSVYVCFGILCFFQLKTPRANPFTGLTESHWNGLSPRVSVEFLLPTLFFPSDTIVSLKRFYGDGRC